MPKVVNLRDYKINKRAFRGGSVGGSSLLLALDTAEPSVNVAPEISINDGTVTFNFVLFDNDIIEFKTWGDYNVTPTGINYDLCGTTEESAPWVSQVTTIEYSLDVVSPVRTYDFYFKFKDDVDNIAHLEILDEFERTKLLDVGDFTRSKEQYLTLTLGDDLGVYADEYKLEARLFDTFYYEEAILDKPSERPVLVFGFDSTSGKELVSVDLLTLEDGSSFDGVYVSTFSKEKYSVKDTSVFKSLLLEKELVSHKEEQEFFVSDIVEVSNTKESGIIDAAYSDHGGPYGVFFYFAVKIKEHAESMELPNFMLLAEDKIDFTENTQLLLPWRETYFIEDVKATVDYRLLQKDSATVSGEKRLDLLVNDTFGYNTKILPELVTRETGAYFIKQWSDVDLLYYDAGKVSLHSAISIPAEITGISYQGSILDVALEEGGVFLEPKWSFDVNAFEEAFGKESIVYSLAGTDPGASQEYGVENILFSEIGIVPQPKWAFEVNSFEYMSFKESLAASIIGTDLFDVQESPVLNTFAKDLADYKYRSLVDEDLLYKDFVDGSEGVIFDLPVIEDLRSNEESVIVIDVNFVYVGIDKTSEFHRILQDYGFGKDVSYGIMPAIYDVYVVEDTSEIGIQGTDKFSVIDQHPLIDEDILIKDSGIGKDDLTIHIPGEDTFISYEEPVIEIWSQVNYVADFYVDIYVPTPGVDYIFVYEWGLVTEKSEIRQKMEDTGLGYDVPIIDLFKNDAGVGKDFANFERILQDYAIGFESRAVLGLQAIESGFVNVEPVISLLSTELVTLKDILAVFEKIVPDIGSGTDGLHNIVIPANDNFGYSDDVVIGAHTEDVGITKDILSTFEKRIQEFSLEKENALIQQQLSAIGISVEYGVIDLFGFDAGISTEKQGITVLLLQREYAPVKELLNVSILGQEIVYTKEQADILPCVFESPVGHDKQYITELLVDSDPAKSFESNAMIDLAVEDLGRAWFESAFSFFASDAGHPEFYCDIAIDEIIIYVNVYDIAFGTDYFVQMDIPGVDAGRISAEYGVIQTFSYDVVTSGEFVRSIDKEFITRDFGDHCYNTIIYDPTIEQERDLIYWWEPGYAPGGSKYSGTLGDVNVNPDWGKPIKVTDVDYPYLKDDPRYGQEIPFTGETKSLYSYYNGDYEFSGVGHWGWDSTGTRWIWYPYTRMPIHREKSTFLFDSYAPTFDIKTLRVDSFESYLVTAQLIPWDTEFYYTITCHHYVAPGVYNILPKVVIPTTVTIRSQMWSVDNVRHTIYDLDTGGSEINCYDYFTGKDLSKDYFTVEFYGSYLWIADFYDGVSYRMDAEYYYYGESALAAPIYVQTRRQVLYDEDYWFVPKDVLYYEPTVFKLYINMECGTAPFIDRPPATMMDKFVLDQMTRHQKLNIIANYVGDHAVVNEDMVVSLYHSVDVKYQEKWMIDYTLLFHDFGYTCEDIVIYSRSDFQDRDILYWWNSDYPNKSTTEYVPNPLLGEDIKPGDFDYPYAPDTAEYGTIIQAKRTTGIPAKFNPYVYDGYVREWKYSGDSLKTNYYVFPLAKLTDGVDLNIAGHIKVSVGKCKVSFAVRRFNIEPITYPFVFSEDFESFYVVREFATVSADLNNIDEDKIYHYIPKDVIYRGVSATVRTQDVLNSGVFDDNENLWVCVFIEATEELYRDAGHSDWEVEYDFKTDFDVSLVEYEKQYSDIRAVGMPKTDGEFIVRDFYPDLFKFKFYVNLGCGTDLDLFPIEPVDDFERWVFIKARTQGNMSLDYLYSGDYDQVIETPVIMLEEELNIKMKFHWYFNNFEFQVFDFGTLTEYRPDIIITGADDGYFKEKSPIIMLPEVIVADLEYHINIDATFTLYEFGTLEITPMMDLFTADAANVFNETPVISQNMEIDAKLDFVVSFWVKFSLFENVMCLDRDILTIPINGEFYTNDETTISINKVVEIEGDDRDKKIEFIYVFEYGDSEDEPLVNGAIDKLYSLLADPWIDVAVNYNGQSHEYVRPNRNEIYYEIGYVCFWVQIVNYPYVIDWLAGHFVDYFEDLMEAEYVRFTTCFGMPPGNWPPVSNYPSTEILPDPRVPHLEKDPNKPHEGYRHKERKPDKTDRSHGYVRIPGPGDEVTYIINPADPPEPYVWVGGTSIFVTKTIMDMAFEHTMLVIDAFYFALFDLDGNRVSDVQVMTLRDSKKYDGTIIPGASYGAMVFFDLEPNTTYVVKETDEFGVPLKASFTSEYSGNTYVLPQDGLRVTTSEGKCSDAGNMNNMAEEFGPGELKPLPIQTNDYDPRVYPTDESGTREYPKNVSPFEIPGHGEKPEESFQPESILPYVDDEYGPAIIPSQYDPDVPDYLPVDVPGYEGRLEYLYDFNYTKDSAVISIPVEMLSVIWEYHYIPATFVLELSGMRIEWLDGFSFEMEEPFRFELDGFGVSVEEPFRFDATEFLIETEQIFAFDEDNFLIEQDESFEIKETKFEFEAQFEDFAFDWDDYTGRQDQPTPEVIGEVITYDGEEHSLCYSKGHHGAILYQIDDEPWSTEIPKRKNAGSYQVKWYAMASLLYTEYGSEDEYSVVNCVIQKADADISIDSVTVQYESTIEVPFFYYGDGEISCYASDPTACEVELLSVNVALAGQSTVKRCICKITGKRSGTTTVIFTSTSGDNYLPMQKSVDVEVLPAEITFVALPVIVDYTGDAPNSNISVYGPTRYTIQYCEQSIPSEEYPYYDTLDPWKNVGETTIYFKISADNYDTVYGKFSLIVNPIPQDIHIVPNKQTYDGSEIVLIKEVGGEFGTCWFSLDHENWSSAYPTAVEPGKYMIYWYCIGDVNHYDDGTAQYPNTITAEIEKMPLSVHIDNVTMDVAQIEPTIVTVDTPSTGKLTVTYSDYESIICEVSGFDLVITPVKRGEVFVHVRQAEDAYYKEGVFAFHVTVEDTQIVYSVSTIEHTYDGSIVEETGIIVTAPAAYILKYSKSEDYSQFTPKPNYYSDAGDYKIYFEISSPGYTTVRGSYDLIIHKAYNPIQVRGIHEVYNGTSQPLAEYTPGYYGDLYFRLYGSYSQAVPRRDLPSTYHVYWYCDGGKNYESIGSAVRPQVVFSEIYRADIVSEEKFIEIRNGKEYRGFIKTPSIAGFDLIEYIGPGSECIDKDRTYFEKMSSGSYRLHIMSAQVGHCKMRVHQKEGPIYNEHWFYLDVTVY